MAADDDITTNLLSDSYPSVTVCFADVVGYTSLAATMTADASMHLLDRLFQRFDTLTTGATRVTCTRPCCLDADASALLSSSQRMACTR
jgi:class 3 adenylate cyclase